MSARKMTDRKEYIDGPAGVTGSFTINGIEMQQIFKGNEEKATKKNVKTVAPKTVKREVLSTDLTQGMSIKAEDGGKPQTRSEETR